MSAERQEKKGVVWDLTSYFPEFNGPEMKKFKEQLAADIKGLQDAAAKLDPLSHGNMDEWEAVIVKAEEVGVNFSHIGSYVGCLTSANAGVEEYALEEGYLMKLGAEFEKFAVDQLRGLKNIPDDVFNAFIGREKLDGMQYSLIRDRYLADYTMTPEMEKLSAELSVDGFHSWGKLYDTVTGKLEFDMVYPDGREERTPISQWRSLMSSADRKTGKAAFECGNKAWAGIEDVCAAALNSIAGNRLVLNRYRGFDHYLEMALFQSRITRKTLDAMYEAIHANIEIPREIFRAKGRSMGREGIYWFEREAPLEVEDSTTFTWEEGSKMVEGAFDTAYPELAGYYRMFLENKWMESEVRPGKRPGAFCTGSPLTREQRVYMTYNGALSDTTTVAHEVGHAWHSHLLKELRPTARSYPMTLAETASIFAEHILADGIYNDDKIDDASKLAMLDADLNGAAALLLDITVRFEFEKQFHDERMNGEVSVSRLKQIMVEKQKEVLGDSMLDGSEDPYFWASKLHFYITGVTFYNFPYTFGFLLARALANMFHKEGAAFLPKYEEFLRLTGSDTVENVAKRALGVDVSDPAFWAESIKSLEPALERYKNLLKQL